MSLGVIKQEEYLKKYLDKKNTSKGKKKKKKILSKLHGFSVVDESVDLKDLPFGGEENDYAPTVAEVTYEDEKAKLIEEFQANRNKWKSFNSNEIDEHEIKIEENEIGLLSVENKIKNNTLSLSSMSGSVTDSVKSEQPSNSNSRHDSTRERDNSDTPPSRSKRHDSDLSSPYRRRHDSDSSPPCKKRHSPHTSPSRRKRYDNVTLSTHQKMHDSNSSPRRKTHSDDTSSSRKKRHDSDTLSYRRNRYDSDTSPTSSPRRCRNDSDASHLRRKRHDSDASLPEQKMNDSCKSPPRGKKQDSKISPSRRKKCYLNMSPRRKPCDSDTSPPRKRNDSDTSPPRRRKDESDTSPPRRRNYSDASPPRRRKYDFGRSTPQRRNDSDTSPPRRRKDDSDTSPPRRRRNDSDTSPPRRRKDGSDFSPPRRKRHGDSITSTSSRIKNNFGSLHHLERCDKDASQVGAPKKDNISSEYPTDSSLSSFSKLKRGEHFKAASFKKIKSKVPKELSEEEKVLARKLEEKYQKWNKGVVQDQKHKEAADYVLHEMGKSFARTADDEDMNRSLKNVMRQEDPMLEYIARKEAKRNIQPLKPRYVGSFPANRFNIAPGYRWDGVDRSNGYEKEWFIKKSSKRATEDESYKWSTEDM